MKADAVVLVFNDRLTRLADIDRDRGALYDVEPGIAQGRDILGQELEEPAGGPVLGVFLGCCGRWPPWCHHGRLARPRRKSPAPC